MEREPTPERMTDEQLIDKALLEARRRYTLITDEAARVIAAQLHGGQDSALYALASTGAIEAGLLMELDNIAKDEHVEALPRSWVRPMEEYVMARVQNDNVKPVEGWGGLWISDRTPRAELPGGLAERFSLFSDDDLVDRIENPGEFGTAAEEAELTRRLKAVGCKWIRLVAGDAIRVVIEFGDQA